MPLFNMKVQLYYTPTCPNCPAAKRVVESVLMEFPDVEYEEMNALEHQQDVLHYGFMVVPAIVIDGHLRFNTIPTKEEFRSSLTGEFRDILESTLHHPHSHNT